MDLDCALLDIAMFKLLTCDIRHTYHLIGLRVYNPDYADHADINRPPGSCRLTDGVVVNPFYTKYCSGCFIQNK